MNESSQEITQLLAAWSQGEEVARTELLPLVYGELRRIAPSYLRRHAPGNTWQTTPVIHEAYLRLSNQPERDWHGRKHFYALAAKIMRDILVDYARQRDQLKRDRVASKAAVKPAQRRTAAMFAERLAHRILGRARQCTTRHLDNDGGGQRRRRGHE